MPKAYFLRKASKAMTWPILSSLTDWSLSGLMALPSPAEMSHVPQARSMAMPAPSKVCSSGPKLTGRAAKAGRPVRGCSLSALC